MDDLTAEDYLPHRGKMILLNKIVHVNKDKAVTKSVVNDQWPLFADNQVSPIIMIELAAQTAGIYIAWNKENEKQRTGKEKGWVVGISSASFFTGLIPVESTILTHITSKLSVDTYMKLNAQMFIGENIAGDIGLQLFWEESGEI